MGKLSNFQLLQMKAREELKTIKDKLDPRTKSAYIDDINFAVGKSAINKLISKFETIRKSNFDKPLTKQFVKNLNKVDHIVKPKKEVMKDYDVKGDVKVNITYTSERGGKKKEAYKHTFTKEKTYHDYSKKIKAKSKEEAERLFQTNLNNEFNNDGMWYSDSEKNKQTEISSVENIKATESSVFEASSPELIHMKNYKPLQYDFIPSDNKLLQNENFCVPDQFIGTYGKHIKKLNLDYFIELCYQVRGEQRHKTVSLLDAGIEDDWEIVDVWDISKGVTPRMLTDICIILDISTYAYDISKKCFLKHISRNRNVEAFVYYAVNNHCYHITDKEAVKSLIEKAKDIEHKITSNCIKEEEYVKDNKFNSLSILENIEIENLKDHKDVIIIYSQPDLNFELNKIIEIYNYIPGTIKNQQYNMTYIHFNYNESNIHLYVDPNFENEVCNYKDVKIQCEKLNLEFNNQTFGTMINQVKRRYFDNINVRYNFKAEERVKIWESREQKCEICNKQVMTKLFELDHRIPFSLGGSNDESNIQLLCKGCHLEKTRSEQEQGYYKISDTESSFNTITKDIFDSKLCGSYAFIEPLKKQRYPEKDSFPKSMKAETIYNIDINKCRKNILYYQKYEYPLFTVMDKPVNYNGQKLPGLYYVETDQYFPFRGNGWYYYPLIEYGLNNNLITSEEVKYALISSLTIPANHYNGFIDYLYANVDEAKLSVNAMIGNFKPKPREQWKSELITEDANEAYYHFLKFKGSFIDVRTVKEKDYYQIYSTTIKSKEETESPIYNQIIELEAIELHKLKTIIESKGGLCLDANTDAVSCVFKRDILPFEMLDDINLKGYYYDDEKKIPMYKVEIKDKRLQYPKLAKYKRGEKYDHKETRWNNIEDVNDNNFIPLVEQVMNSKKSYNIDGRAGTGKSTFIRALQDEMKIRGISYKSLAPTNKAARVINGTTIHRYVVMSSRKSIEQCSFKYLFIDEISMVHEIFYKFFITLKRLKPDLKFIIAGDFRQLLPVNDRVDCDYKTSPALHELCDGNRIQLSRCRRADDTLFNICDPDNIKSLKKTDFIKSDDNKMYMKNLCFTNETRKRINNIMMKKYIEIKMKKAKEAKRRLPVPIILKVNEKDEHSQEVKLLKGMPIIARKTCDKLDIMNNETFTIIDVNDKYFKIITNDTPIEIELKQFQDLFHLAFCMTVYKSQGQTFKEAYNICEWDRYDERMKYVALSRATDKKYIHIN